MQAATLARRQLILAGVRPALASSRPVPPRGRKSSRCEPRSCGRRAHAIAATPGAPVLRIGAGTAENSRKESPALAGVPPNTATPRSRLAVAVRSPGEWLAHRDLRPPFATLGSTAVPRSCRNPLGGSPQAGAASFSGSGVWSPRGSPAPLRPLNGVRQIGQDGGERMLRHVPPLPPPARRLVVLGLSHGLFHSRKGQKSRVRRIALKNAWRKGETLRAH